MEDFSNIDTDSLTRNMNELTGELKGIMDKVTTPEIMETMNPEQKEIIDKATKVFNFDLDSDSVANNLEEVIKIIRT